MEGRQTHPTTPAVSHSSHPYPSEFLPPRSQCNAARGKNLSVWMLLRRRGSESVYRLYAICNDRGRRNASTCSPTVPRGDTPCVTAGDAQRANPWKVDKPTLRHRRCRTAATPIHLSFSLHACNATQPEARMELYSCYSSSKKILFPYT